MNKKCLDCNRIGAWQKARCPDHQRIKDAPRKAYKATLYDATYRNVRTHYNQIFRPNLFKCPFCELPISELPIAIDHHSGLKPSHPHCNSSHGAHNERKP